MVILGAGGFVASATERRLQTLGVDILRISRSDLDLTDEDAGIRLARSLKPTDTLLFIAGKVPVKNEYMLLDNIKIGKSVCEALKLVKVAHVIYISSDAVYANSNKPLTEYSCAHPESLHGVMHLAREVMLASVYDGPLCFLRPTLIYGKGDPHNGYGPNRFIRLAARGENIELFGAGEEQRDHVWINDVAEITSLVILSRTAGKLNIATGEVFSFREIAKKVVSLSKTNSKVSENIRTAPMPHNGYRAFDNAATSRLFPTFKYQSLYRILERIYSEG